MRFVIGILLLASFSFSLYIALFLEVDSMEVVKDMSIKWISAISIFLVFCGGFFYAFNKK